ncbi:MAG: BON domain-containing protein [Chloroflexota bacterium]|nr:BON domain-containing protein [Chloroflexota bacterium]
MNATHDLQHQVQTALMDDPDVSEYGVEVFDSNGVITLTGTVPTTEVRDRVEAIVREVAGVTSVINEIDVV